MQSLHTPARTHEKERRCKDGAPKRAQRPATWHRAMQNHASSHLKKSRHAKIQRKITRQAISKKNHVMQKYSEPGAVATKAAKRLLYERYLNPI
jgi:enterochelin esterase-like enzyme